MTLAMPLSGIPLFAGLSDAAKAELRSACALREYSPGDVILRPGEFGQFSYAIKAAVSVQPASSQRKPAILLGPGEVFGEMSLLSRAPISAAVVAECESQIYAIAGGMFDRLFGNEPVFRKGIAELLADRPRRRTSNKDRALTCAFLGLPSSLSGLSRTVVRGVDHYARVAQIGGFEAGASGNEAVEPRSGRGVRRRIRATCAWWHFLRRGSLKFGPTRVPATPCSGSTMGPLHRTLRFLATGASPIATVRIGAPRIGLVGRTKCGRIAWRRMRSQRL
jgi:CRP-like cAMP-binding protein